MELPAFSCECLQVLKNGLELLFLETQPFQIFLKENIFHFSPAYVDGIMDDLLRFSEVCKTYSHAEKHEWGHKVLFWLVAVFWHISRLWFLGIIDEWRFWWLWGVLHIFFLNKKYVPDCTIIYWGWIIVCGLYYTFFLLMLGSLAQNFWSKNFLNTGWQNKFWWYVCI